MSAPGPTSSRQKLIRALVFVIAFAGAMAVYRTVTAPPDYKPKYHTIAHRFLELESKYAKIPDEEYQLLDDIITEAKSSIHYDPAITNLAAREKQLKDMFATIDSILVRRNFLFPPDAYTVTLHEALSDRSLSPAALENLLSHAHNERRAAHAREHADEPFHLMACNPGAFLYMGICEELGVNLRPVTAPEHIFVRAELDANHHLNYDPNRGRSIADEEYIRDWGIRDWQVREHVFLKPLDERETDAEMYCAIGSSPSTISLLVAANEIECQRKALELNPRCLYSLANLACDLLMDANPSPQARKESLDAAERAVALQPYDGFTHRALSFALAANDRTGDATAEMQKAAEINPEEPILLTMIPQIQAGLQMRDIFRSQNPLLFWLVRDYGWLELLIGLPAIFIALLVMLVRRRIARHNARRAAASPGVGISQRSELAGLNELQRV